MDRYQYLLLMAGCVLITLPLEFVLGARVYRRPRRLLLSLLPVVAIFAVWDVVGILRDHWWYSPEFTTGIMLSVMPIEELVFFVVIPLCGLLTYEAVGAMPAQLARWRNGGGSSTDASAGVSTDASAGGDAAQSLGGDRA